MESPSIPVERSRDLQRRKTRRALMEAGRTSFESEGFEGATVGQIARAAGVAHGTFYVHFESKEALIDELLAEVHEELKGELEPIIGQAHAVPLEQTIRACAEAYLLQIKKRAAFMRAYLERAVRGFGVSEVRDGLNEPMASLLAEALSRMALVNQAAPWLEWKLAARALLAMWLRVGLQHALGDQLSLKDAAEVLTRLSSGAIASLLAPVPPR